MSIMVAENAETTPHSQHKSFRVPKSRGAEYLPRMAPQPLPTDFQIRLRQRLAEMRMSANAASLAAGLSRETVRKLLEPGAGLPRLETLSRLAEALQTTEGFLRGGDADRQPATSMNELTYADDEVEIRAAVAGSHKDGAFQILDNSIGRTPLPRGLKRHTNVYAIIVVNDSMVPEHKPGEIRFATPDIRPRLGDTVVVEFERDPDRGPEAMIGHLVSNGEVTKIGKLNPPGFVEIPAFQRIKLHRIASNQETSSMS